jgi:hypothetical protein
MPTEARSSIKESGFIILLSHGPLTPGRTKIVLTAYNKLRIEDRKRNSGREKITNR